MPKEKINYLLKILGIDQHLIIVYYLKMNTREESPSPGESQETDLEEELENMERWFYSFKKRYNQVQSHRQKQAQWQQHHHELAQDKHQTAEISAGH